MKAIETHYQGYRFRSRLEARWAVYFNTVGLKWEYETEGYKLSDGSCYLPDFWLPDLNCFAEVKPKTFSKQEFDKCALLECPIILLDGPICNKGWYCIVQDLNSNYTNYLSNDEYGRVVLELSKNKNRLWFLFGESIKDYWLDLTPVSAAKSARFEFGEQP